MKIFIQKNRLIRYPSFFNSTYFSIPSHREKFSFQKKKKIERKKNLKKAHLIKDRIFKIHAESFKKASIELAVRIPNGRKKKKKSKLEKSFVRFENPIGAFLRQFPRDGYRARQFAKQPRRSISPRGNT